jgi:LmbE family N-acetylglucosaminyl deacetylase
MPDKPELKAATQTPRRVLAIAAHPDDIEFGASGSIARWVKEGAQVTYCIVTDGAAGSNTPDEDLKALVQTRQAEQCEAAEKVGVSDVIFLGYPDGALQPTIELRRDLTRVIRQIKPDRVIVQDPTTIFVETDYINHPDHRAAGEAAIYAVFPSAETRPIFPELLAEGHEPHHVTELYLDMSLQPNTFVDISDTLEQKVAALLCHKSQVGEEAGKSVREWAGESGKQVGVTFAEHFRVMRFEKKDDNKEQ